VELTLRCEWRTKRGSRDEVVPRGNHRQCRHVDSLPSLLRAATCLLLI
jgi:hypothetical protein